MGELLLIDQNVLNKAVNKDIINKFSNTSSLSITKDNTGIVSGVTNTIQKQLTETLLNWIIVNQYIRSDPSAQTATINFINNINQTKKLHKYDEEAENLLKIMIFIILNHQTTFH